MQFCLKLVLRFNLNTACGFNR